MFDCFRQAWFFLGSNAAEIIALCALIFTAWQAYIQRRHNRITMRPHLIRYTNKNRQNNQAQLQVLLINNGLGPAFINKFEVFFKGEPCDSEEGVKKALGDLQNNASHTILGDDYAMAAGEAKVLLSVTFNITKLEDIEVAEGKFDLLDLRVEYSSAYEKMPILDTREE